jgi:hypothetical protein
MRKLPQYPHPTWTDTIPLIARVGPPDILGMIERGSEKDINPSVKAARGIGGTASRAMFRDPADQANSIDPNAIVGTQGENNPTAARLLDDLKKRVEAGKAGALTAPIPSESLEIINNLNRSAE